MGKGIQSCGHCVIISLNGATQNTMLEAIFSSVSIHISLMTLEEFADAVRSGRFALVLDGFDEIDYDKRRKYLQELNELCENYPSARVMMTSRREDSVEHLRSFAVYNVLPMTKEQIIELLTKIDYDNETKSSFIQRVESNLFDKHHDFLSIPLLATMMLLTFSQYSDIPSKIHVFYQQAFEVLFQRHDRSKGGAYTRKSQTNLSIDVFQNVFAYFCAASYSSGKLSFSDAAILQQVSEALNFERCIVSPSLFLKDLTESTCLLQREGLEFAFVHRSFQEYFTALFLSKLDSKSLAAGVNSVVRRQSTDSVIEMLSDIDRASFEQSWALPSIKSIRTKLSKFDPATQTALCFKQMFSQFHLGKTVSISLNRGKLLGMQLYTLDCIFTEEFRRNKDTLGDDNLDAFRSELRSNEEFRYQLSTLFPVQELLEEVDANTEPHHNYLIEFARLPQLAFDLLGLTKWMTVQLEILKSLQEDIVNRIDSRKVTLASVFPQLSTRKAGQR